MTEHFLQYIWFHRLYIPNQQTADGRNLEIINPGSWNNDEGPDAFNAKIKIDGILWVGNIEIHTKASHWKIHQHDLNRNYDNVILHVVAENDQPLIMQNGKAMPTLILKINTALIETYNALNNGGANLKCEKKLQYIDELHKESFTEQMCFDRIKRKSDNVRSILEKNQGNIEQSFFAMLCRSFGFSINADAMQNLAISFPHNLLYKISDNQLQIEALLLGQAGFLDKDFNDSYPKLLASEYEYIKHKNKLNPITPFQFKMMRLRPQNFPTIRIAQLANLLYKSTSLFSKIHEVNDLEQLYTILTCTASEYWNTHYTLDGKVSSNRKKTISHNSINSIIINAIVPYMFYCAEEWQNETYSQRAIDLLEKLPAESNHITELFSQLGFKNTNALHSQGYIEAYKEHCSKANCMKCPLCYQILKGTSIF